MRKGGLCCYELYSTIRQFSFDSAFYGMIQTDCFQLTPETPQNHPFSTTCLPREVHLIITRELIRNIRRVQTPTRHTGLAIIAPVNRNMAPITQIATPTSLHAVILEQVIKSGFDLRARHAHRVVRLAVAFEHGGAAVVGVEREEIVDDGVGARGEDV